MYGIFFSFDFSVDRIFSLQLSVQNMHFKLRDESHILVLDCFLYFQGWYWGMQVGCFFILSSSLQSPLRALCDVLVA